MPPARPNRWALVTLLTPLALQHAPPRLANGGLAQPAHGIRLATERGKALVAIGGRLGREALARPRKPREVFLRKALVVPQAAQGHQGHAIELAAIERLALVAPKHLVIGLQRGIHPLDGLGLRGDLGGIVWRGERGGWGRGTGSRPGQLKLDVDSRPGHGTGPDPGVSPGVSPRLRRRRIPGGTALVLALCLAAVIDPAHGFGRVAPQDLLLQVGQEQCRGLDAARDLLRTIFGRAAQRASGRKLFPGLVGVLKFERRKAHGEERRGGRGIPITGRRSVGKPNSRPESRRPS